MISFKQYLEEIFDSGNIFKYKIKYEYPTSAEYTFLTKKGIEITVNASFNSGTMSIAFSGKDEDGDKSYGIINSGEPIPTLNTVLTIIKEVINKRPYIKLIEFSADKDERSRSKVYSRMIKKFVPSNWKVKIIEDPDFIDFEISVVQ